MRNILKFIFKRDFLIYLLAAGVLAVVISFAVAGAGLKNRMETYSGSAQSASQDTAALSELEKNLNAYVEVLRFLRNLPVTNKKKINYPEYKLAGIKESLGKVQNKQIASQLEALLVLQYQPLNWDRISDRNLNAVIKQNKDIIKKIAQFKAMLSGPAGAGGGPANFFRPVLNILLFISLFFLLLLGAWALYYHKISNDFAMGLLNERFEDGGGVIKLAPALGFERLVSGFIMNLKTVKSNSSRAAAEFKEMTGTLKDIMTSFTEVSSTADAISGSSQELARKMTGYAESVKNTREITRNISEDIEKIREETNKGSVYSKKMDETAKEGGQKITSTIDEINSINNIMADLNKTVNHMGTKTVEISKVTTLIKEIAEQTNLLALNASIEAARAGEAGRGFAVVAEEIRQLAESTAAASKKISEEVKDINRTTEATVTKINAAATGINAGVEIANNAGVAFENIKSVIEATMEITGSIYTLTTDEVKKIQDIISIIARIEHMIEDMASNVENISASIEEETASIENLRSVMEDLYRRSEKMKSVFDSVVT
jgi:methyl-accepting chemotaxis protein